MVLIRRGFSGLHVDPVEVDVDRQESKAEKDFYQASRNQAEDVSREQLFGVSFEEGTRRISSDEIDP